MSVLVVNCGSSSLKFRVVRASDGGEMTTLADGAVSRIATGGWFGVRTAGGEAIEEVLPVPDYATAARKVIDWLRGVGLYDEVKAVGHRVVHGGDQLSSPTLIDDAVVEHIKAVDELAPLHNRPALAAFDVCRQVLPAGLPMVAVFDTAFHHAMPARAARYAIPREWAERHGVRRYGFHGLAHRSMAERFTTLAPPGRSARIITLQLGGGCSAAAIDGGRCVDTTMGFTPLEGLMMGTRAGDIDPAVVPHLAAREGVSAAEVLGWLNTRCGLLGVSGRSADLQEILRAEEEGDADAALAADMFCHRVRKVIGAYLAVLGGADAVVFGGGIGENSPTIRERVCAGMGWCGLRLDPEANATTVGREGRISTPDSEPAVYVIPPDESEVIARDTLDCLAGPAR